MVALGCETWLGELALGVLELEPPAPDGTDAEPLEPPAPDELELDELDELPPAPPLPPVPLAVPVPAFALAVPALGVEVALGVDAARDVELLLAGTKVVPEAPSSS